MLPGLKDTRFEELLRRMRAADKAPLAHWERVLKRIEAGEITSPYVERLCREALAQLRPQREPGQDESEAAE